MKRVTTFATAIAISTLFLTAGCASRQSQLRWKMSILAPTAAPLMTRWEAIKTLWLHSSYWRLPEPLRLMREFRDEQLVEMMLFLSSLVFLLAAPYLC
jgi:hypothetical protein